MTQSAKRLHYVTEEADWAIRTVGENLTQHLERPAQLKTGFLTSFNSILHFGSRSALLPRKYRLLMPWHRSVALTWYHSADEDKLFIDALRKAQHRCQLIHTSCSVSERQLLDWGISHDKIVVLPIGVDLKLFKPMINPAQIKQELGLPIERVIVGSFQKDGNGWGEGTDPKLIKGPDIFVDAVTELNRKFPVYVLLTGPARGYVKNELTKRNIPYKHYMADSPSEMARYYNALDLYMICSRAEGGPNAMMESMATGTPLVTTPVGMCVDHIADGKNGFISAGFSPKEIAQKAITVLSDESLRTRTTTEALSYVQRLSWKTLAPLYEREIYSLLDKRGRL